MRRTATLLCLLALTACANLSTPTSSAPGTPPAPATPPSPAEQAAEFLNVALAAETPTARIAALEDACWAATRAAAPALLDQALSLYPEAALSADRKAVYDTYLAQRQVLGDTPRVALETLSRSARPRDDRSLADYHLTRAMAYERLDDGQAATAALVQRGLSLTGEQAQENRARIWTLLQQPSRFVFADETSTFDNRTQGWLALGRIARHYWPDEFSLQRALLQWQRDFPVHPANPEFLEQARGLANETLAAAIHRIAVLLPVSGRLAGPGAAIRDGMLAAHLESSNREVELRFYDSSNLDRAHAEAVADGAEMLVGPLDKQQIPALLDRNAGLLPVLTLNYRDTQGQALPYLLEYGLAPEDEARASAMQAYADGGRTAIALYSGHDWGLRALEAFRETFTEAGGTVMDQRQFHGGPKAYPDTIKALLRLEESRARTRRLESILGLELDAEPVRRQDADLLFLAASPQQGRQIRPQLRFYHASDLPIYAGGRIYSGQASARLDRDLNEVRFCAMPWLLNNSETWRSRREAIESVWPREAARFGRLYAMGHDAYLLATSLRGGNWSGLPEIPGATGTLVRQGHRIQRLLPCARFVDGLPQPLPPRQAEPERSSL